ncbi:MAG: tryptophan-rich sensory protein [Clostridia bacterium]|nr:tryptophan-rich sensory protein [Clostridia bacterium]
MKSVSNEIKRKLRAQTACINWTTVAIACGAAILVGILFAINGVNAKLFKDMIKPACALPAWLIIPLFAIAVCALTFSCVCVLSSPAKLRPKQQKIMPVLYFAALALSYIWIPLTYKAAAFFASFIVCVILLAILCVIYTLIARTEKLASVMLIVFAVWAAYLTYLSIGLFFVN